MSLNWKYENVADIHPHPRGYVLCLVAQSSTCALHLLRTNLTTKRKGLKLKELLASYIHKYECLQNLSTIDMHVNVFLKNESATLHHLLNEGEFPVFRMWRGRGNFKCPVFRNRICLYSFVLSLRNSFCIERGEILRFANIETFWKLCYETRNGKDLSILIEILEIYFARLVHFCAYILNFFLNGFHLALQRVHQINNSVRKIEKN